MEVKPLSLKIKIVVAISIILCIITSHVTAEDDEYRFTGLRPNNPYIVWYLPKELRDDLETVIDDYLDEFHSTTLFTNIDYYHDDADDINRYNKLHDLGIAIGVGFGGPTKGFTKNYDDDDWINYFESKGKRINNTFYPTFSFDELRICLDTEERNNTFFSALQELDLKPDNPFVLVYVAVDDSWWASVDDLAVSVNAGDIDIVAYECYPFKRDKSYPDDIRKWREPVIDEDFIWDDGWLQYEVKDVLDKFKNQGIINKV